MAASNSLYKIPMQEVLSDRNLIYKKSRYRCTTPHHICINKVSKVKQFVRLSQHQAYWKRRWTKCVSGNIKNADFKRDSSEVQHCNQHRRLCTARLDSLNRVILWHNEGIWWTTYQCLLDTIFELTWRGSWFWQAYRPPCTCIPLVHNSRYVSHHETSIRRR